MRFFQFLVSFKVADSLTVTSESSFTLAKPTNSQHRTPPKFVRDAMLAI